MIQRSHGRRIVNDVARTALVLSAAPIVMVVTAGCFRNGDAEPVSTIQAENPYLGETPPGAEPVIFAPGIVSTPDLIEMGITFSPDGREIYFSRSVEPEISSRFSIWISREGRGGWEPPRVAVFSTRRDFAPFMMPDGTRFLFYSQDHSDPEYRDGTYVTERTGDSWSQPVYYSEAYCITSSLEGDLFSSAGDPDDRNILTFRETDVGFTEPQDPGGGVNSIHFDAHSFVSPDGSFMLFDSSRPGEFEHSEIHVSFRNPDGTWSDASSLGPTVNATHSHIPSLSPDGKYLFFSRENDIWWVSSQIIHELKDELLGS